MHTCWDLHRIPGIKTRKPVSKPRPCVGRGKKPQGEMEPSSKEEHQTKAGLQSLQGHLGRLGGSPKEVQCIPDTEQFLAAGAETHPNVRPCTRPPSKAIPATVSPKQQWMFSIRQHSSRPPLPPPLYFDNLFLCYIQWCHISGKTEISRVSFFRFGVVFFPSFIASKKQPGRGDNWPNLALLVV